MLKIEYDRYCLECGTTYGIENHHVVYKSKCKPLEDCKENQIDLCYIHHRDHKKGIHHNKVLDIKYKLRFQNYLEIHLLKEYLTREEIKEVLGIADKPLNRLLSSLIMHNGMYNREDVIFWCMGKQKIIESEVNNE